MVLNPVISKLAGKLVVLASASPRRREILTNVGLRFEVVPSWFKETLDKSLFGSPQDYAVETAKQKALEVAKRMPFKHLKTPDIVIGADTVVTVDGLILEKPVDKQDAYRMLSRLNGKEHSVFTGVAIILCHEKEGKNIEYNAVDFYEETRVKFADLSEEMLWEYIHSGEPMDKAGGYGIQALGGMLVEYVHGDFLNVVGFPLNHFCKQLNKIFNGSAGTLAVPVDRTSRTADGGPDRPSRREGTTEAAQASGRAERTQIAAEPERRAGGSTAFPHRIAHLLDGFKASKALFAASALKVFDLLDAGHGLTAVQVAEKIAASVVGVERLLDAAVSLGLLEKVQRGEVAVYRNTEEASRYLISTSDLSLHGYIVHSNDVLWPLFTHLEHGVREGSSQHERAFGKQPQDLFQDAYYSSEERKLRFLDAMHSISKVTAGDVATAFDLSGFRTACDVGGCTGAMAYEFAKAYPGMSITVFDLPAVIELNHHFQPHDQDCSRVTFVAGDFFKDDLPKADLYILARILHDWSDDKVHILLRKLSEACSPGGAVLVSEILLEEGRRGPRRALLQALSMTPGSQRSGSEYCLLLKAHGFSQVHVRHTGNFLDAVLGVRL
ncbi:putative bifunctional dTTP/UTP pyrophosphatase/methyltransferase protein [Scleropages formosus]|uniref:Acetylserotonin O-methyltransferase-like n=1 Tax=Scleropages formosus TaxID=113540 RepID=A0A8C9SNZ8_SCLFO|nr:probable bifunctional dTTP/UTP pyrophosphatase/methyltransferase protein [Scleropages formosus]